MFWLSGDQFGLYATHDRPNEVSCVALVPSLSQTQISLAPERHDTNAILWPSGE